MHAVASVLNFKGSGHEKKIKTRPFPSLVWIKKVAGEPRLVCGLGAKPGNTKDLLDGRFPVLTGHSWLPRIVSRFFLFSPVNGIAIYRFSFLFYSQGSVILLVYRKSRHVVGLTISGVTSCVLFIFSGFSVNRLSTALLRTLNYLYYYCG